jgi:large subunit ribosomal protein L21
MYAIIETDGRQIKVEEGQKLLIDYRDAAAGSALEFDRVLALRDDAGLKIGRPLLEGVSVSAEIVGVRQGPKLVVQKLRRRKTFRKKTGHRQMFTEVQINKIQA